MLSGNAFIGTIELFGDSLTDTTDGGFFYRLDQGNVAVTGSVSSRSFSLSVSSLDILSDQVVLGGVVSHSVNGSEQVWYLDANEQVISANMPTLGNSLGVSLSITDADDSAAVFNSWNGDLGGLDQMLIVVSGQDGLRTFLSKPEITRIPLVPPMLGELKNASEGVINLAGMFDANQRTDATELLAIRSALLVSQLDSPLPGKFGDEQSVDRIALQEAESDSTWDRVWTFELASFQSHSSSGDSNNVTENLPITESVAPRANVAQPLRSSPLESDLLTRRQIEEGVFSVGNPTDEVAFVAHARAEAFSELEMEQRAVSSNAWGLAADRRGGLAISAVALLVAQQAWSVSSAPAKEEKKIEPRRNYGTTKIKTDFK